MKKIAILLSLIVSVSLSQVKVLDFSKSYENSNASIPLLFDAGSFSSRSKSYNDNGKTYTIFEYDTFLNFNPYVRNLYNRIIYDHQKNDIIKSSFVPSSFMNWDWKDINNSKLYVFSGVKIPLSKYPVLIYKP